MEPLFPLAIADNVPPIPGLRYLPEYLNETEERALVEAIEGDFWNVVGLPVPELVRLLKSPC